MQLHAALVPPPELVREALGVLRDLGDPHRPDGAPDEADRRGGLGRLFRRTRTDTRRTSLDLIDPEMVLLPVTSLGNLTPRDAERLAEAVAEVLAPLARPVVRVHGGVALEPMGDDRVQGRLTGDEAGLRAVVFAALGSAERVGIFSDRRVFRPLLPLARVNEATTEADLEAALAALEALEGRAWVVDHVALLQRPVEPGEPSRELRRIPVGTG